MTCLLNNWCEYYLLTVLLVQRWHDIIRTLILSKLKKPYVIEYTRNSWRSYFVGVEVHFFLSMVLDGGPSCSFGTRD